MRWATDPPNGGLPSDVDELDMVHALEAAHAVMPMQSLSFTRLGAGPHAKWRYEYQTIAGGNSDRWIQELRIVEGRDEPKMNFKHINGDDWFESDFKHHRLVRWLCYVWAVRIPNLMLITATFPVDEVMP